MKPCMARSLLAIFLLLWFAGAWAEFPERPISLILPTPPGGAADLNARPLARHLLEVLNPQSSPPATADTRTGSGNQPQSAATPCPARTRPGFDSAPTGG